MVEWESDRNEKLRILRKYDIKIQTQMTLCKIFPLY